MESATPLANLFLHFFDKHFLDEVGFRVSQRTIAAEADLAIRVGVLAARTLIVPAASYFESPVCRTVLDRFESLLADGTIRIAGSGRNAEIFATIKLDQYDEGSAQHQTYQAFIEGAEPAPPFLTRRRSATLDLQTAWLDLAHTPDLVTRIFEGTAGSVPLSFEEDWTSVPERLGSRAFTPEYVTTLLLGRKPHPAVRSNISEVINGGYFDSYSREYQAGFIIDLVALDTGYALSNVFGNVPLRKVRDFLAAAGMLETVKHATPEQLVALRTHPAVIEAMLSSIDAVAAAPLLLQPVKLPIQLDLQNQLEAIRAIKPGAKQANAYHRAVADLLNDVFSASLQHMTLEDPINQRRKRIDITWLNTAHVGFFQWLHRSYTANYIYAEAKNYTDDPANPEIDQLLGRFSPHRTKVGFLLFRSVADRDTAIKRCRDAVADQQGFVLIIDDTDLQELVNRSQDPSWGSGHSEWLHERWKEII